MLVNGSIAHRTLMILSQALEPLTDRAIFTILTAMGVETTLDQLTSEQLAWLETHCHVAVQDFDDTDDIAPMFVITLAGTNALATLAAAAAAKAAEVPPSVAGPIVVGRFKEGTYHCPELRRTSHRAGAFTAFDLPSVINGKVHQRKAPDA